MRRTILAVVAAAVLIIGALVVAHARSDGRPSMVASPDAMTPDHASDLVPPTSGSAPVAAVADPGPTRSAAIPAGDIDVDGARASAVAAVARTREVTEAGALERRDVIAEFATSGFAPVLAERTSQQWVALLYGLRRETGQAVRVRVLSQPVTASASAVGDGRVRVEVWAVTVFLADGESPVPEQWSTFRLEMVDEGGRWLVDGWESTPGPSPVPAPEGSFGTDVEIAAVMAWPPAGVSGGG